MIQNQLTELEAAVVGRNPLLATRLIPGLSQHEIGAKLRKARLAGNLQSVIALYSWRNGTLFDQPLMLSKTGFFPGEVYQYIDLDRAIQHMKSHKRCIFASSPELAGRYLPVFWDGTTNWVSLDLKGANTTPVALIRFFVCEPALVDGEYQPEVPEKDPPREAYHSFEEFVADAIRANRENTMLTGLRKQG